MEHKPTTKDDFERLEEQLVAEVREWFKENAPKVHSSDSVSAIEIVLRGDDHTYADDDTPLLSADVSIRYERGELVGWIR